MDSKGEPRNTWEGRLRGFYANGRQSTAHGNENVPVQAQLRSRSCSKGGKFRRECSGVIILGVGLGLRCPKAPRGATWNRWPTLITE